MKFTRNWLIATGIWYVLNLPMLWPSLYGPMLPDVYPGIALYQGEPVFRLMTDLWLLLGGTIAAIGVINLWGARNPAKYLALIPVAIAMEIYGAVWDIYSITYSHESPMVGIITIAVHLLIIVTGIMAWKAAHATGA
jgi:hypothetical protein